MSDRTASAGASFRSVRIPAFWRRACSHPTSRVLHRGSHGIRTENLSLCRKAEKNEYGQFMCFENMTFAPIDLDAVDISVMEPSDVENAERVP